MFRFGDPGGRMYTSVGTSNVNFLSHWSSIVVAGSPTLSVNSGTGRTTGSSLRVVNGNGSTNISLLKNLDNQATWGVAYAMKVSAMVTSSTVLLALLDTASTQVDLRLDSSGTLTVTRNGTSLGTASGVVAANAWVHIELKVKIDPSVGTVYLAVNGSQKLSLTSQNTRATSNSFANVFQLGSTSAPGVATTWDYDDIIVYDGQTTDAVGNADITGPIGDCGLSWLLPTGAGTTTQYTADTGSNYPRVSETTPDGDTSYVESSTVGNIDTYATADLAAAITSVKSMALVHYARKTDVGSRQMGAVIRTGSTNYVHPTGIDLGNSYQYYFRNWGQNPNTVANWTPTNINAIEIGQKVNS